ncbi:hypothetical protein SCUP234_07562 [Seiridium cupressi]
MSSYRIGDRELLCDPPPPDKAPDGKKRKSTSRTCHVPDASKLMSNASKEQSTEIAAALLVNLAANYEIVA